jgi:hypothetical protein
VPCRGEPPYLVIGMQVMWTTAGVDTVLRVAPPWMKANKGDYYDISSINEHVHTTRGVNRRTQRPLKGKDYITCVDTSLRQSKVQRIRTQGVRSAAKLQSCVSRIRTINYQRLHFSAYCQRRRMDSDVDFVERVRAG